VPCSYCWQRTSQNAIKKLSEKPHERANLLAIRRLIATWIKASPI
jgi:hypothetical protein